MDNLSSVFSSALIGGVAGFFVRELLIYIVQEFCERMILFRCRNLPPDVKSEILDSMMADMKDQRSIIRMIKIALVGSWDNNQPPTIQKEDKNQ